VLVVDDALTELVYLSEILSKHGYAVRTATNGEEAMRSLAEQKPDAILMDVVMPGQNGYQLTRALSKDPAYSAIPVVICTSKSQESDRVWGMRQGARDYLVKPIRAEQLLASLRALG
jgi:twitching motility two-component system response regulator PilH